MADTTTPVTGTTPTPQDATQVNDLQINLAEAPKEENKSDNLQKSSDNNPQTSSVSDLDLSLDLNLPDAPKDDDRLKTEDQKNKETIIDPINKTVSTENLSDRRGNEGEVATESTTTEGSLDKGRNEEGFVAKVEVPVPTTPEPTPEPTPEIVPETPIESTPVVVPEPIVEIIPETKETSIQSSEILGNNLQTSSDEIIGENPQISTTIEELPTSSEILGNNPQASSDILGGNLPKSTSNLQEDMKMIEDMEGHASAGGLAPEAMITPQLTPIDTPKTFDLDAMLGTTEGLLDKGGNEGGFVAEAKKSEETIKQTTPQQKAVEPQVIPAFTIPIQSSAILGGNPPISSVNNLQISSDKTSGVKVLLFIVLFVALGFTTFFILKTMYPIEFASMFNGGETQMHAVSAEVTGTIEGLTGDTVTGDTITGEIPGVTGEILSGENSGDAAFGELNDLTTTVAPQAETDVSRLTDYLTKGNDFVTQGNTIHNNTVIKYGLYISKKSTAFLEKIANGEEINNLSGYFAQFDQYITELGNILAQTIQPVSPTLPTNEPEAITGTTPTETNTGITSE